MTCVKRLPSRNGCKTTRRGEPRRLPEPEFAESAEIRGGATSVIQGYEISSRSTPQTWAICIRLKRANSLTGASPVIPYNSGVTMAVLMNICIIRSAHTARASFSDTEPEKICKLSGGARQVRQKLFEYSNPCWVLIVEKWGTIFIEISVSIFSSNLASLATSIGRTTLLEATLLWKVVWLALLILVKTYRNFFNNVYRITTFQIIYTVWAR